MPIDAAIRSVRTKQNEALPAYYDWKLHVGANGLLLSLPLLAVFRAVGRFGKSDLALFLLFLLLWSLAEYLIHRQILHGPRFRHTSLQRQHLAHHGYFTRRFMVLESQIDVNRVILFTTYLAMTVALVSASSAALGLLAGRRPSLLFLAAGLLHILFYEGAHAVSHLRGPSSLPGLRRIARHHRIHHDPAIAARANFATTFPFWDALLGTRRKEIPDA